VLVCACMCGIEGGGSERGLLVDSYSSSILEKQTDEVVHPKHNKKTYGELMKLSKVRIINL